MGLQNILYSHINPEQKKKIESYWRDYHFLFLDILQRYINKNCMILVKPDIYTNGIK